MYPVDKVYSAFGEFQLEEVFAAGWKMRKRQKEEREKIERESEWRKRYFGGGYDDDDARYVACKSSLKSTQRQDAFICFSMV